MAQSSFTAKDGAGNNVDVWQTDDPPEKTDLTALADRLGEVHVDPTANTVLARLKAAVDALGGTLTVDASGQALTINLPAGAATEAKQDSIVTALGSLLTESVFQSVLGEVQASPTSNTVLARLKAITDALGGTLTVDASGQILAISLPSGAATEAKQDSVISALQGLLPETTFQTILGEVQASPSANTVLARLKAIADALGGTVTVDASGQTLSVALPNGAATEVKQDSAISELQSIVTALGGTLTVDGSAVTQPVSAASLPLPAGAATEATLADAVKPDSRPINSADGAVDLSATPAHLIAVETDAVFTALTGAHASYSDGRTVKAGSLITATAGITSVELTSGSVIAYY